MPINYQLITSNEELEACCRQAAEAKYVALDTEFVRTRTYYPRLGLIQLFDGKKTSLIDPLPISEWRPFCQLLANPEIIKILHASSEDLDVFQHQFGLMPTPLIDTQIFASFCGYPLSCGYARLISDKLGITLDKTETRTDWLARPLTDKQCFYAAADVYYLLPLATLLIEKISELGWFDAAIDECLQAIQKRNATVESDRAYIKITHAWQLNQRQLGALQKLAAWRLDYARNKDMAINFVVKEEHLYKVAKVMPDSLAQLEMMGLSGPEIRFHGKTMLDLVAEAKRLPTESLPNTIIRLADRVGYKNAFKLLKERLQAIAERHSISYELMASRRQINQLLKWHWQQGSERPVLLNGWRETLTKTELLTLLNEL